MGFIFASNFKRHYCEVTNLQLGHDLSTSENRQSISTFGESLIFTKLKSSNPSEDV